jgi:hypothetical protein
MEEAGGARFMSLAGVNKSHRSGRRRFVGQPEVPAGVCTRITAVPGRYPACKTDYSASQKW